MKTEKKVILASSIGNILEFYDFALYGFFANIISKLYFPSDNSVTSLLVFYGVFAVGFVCRPLGAILFGYLGDILDRRSTLSFSLLGIAGATFLMGVLPTYEKWGIMAPISLTVLRMIQGISLGGEYSNSLIFVSEHMEKVKSKYPSFATGMISSMGLIGWFVASFFSVYFRHLEFDALSWRIPFLIGSLVAVVGIFLRTKVSDSFIPNEQEKGAFIKNFVQIFHYPREILPSVGVGLLMGGLFYGQFIFGKSFLPMVANISSETAGKVITLGLLAYMLCLPLLGLIADRFGHKKVVLSSCFSCVFLAPVLFYLEISSSLTMIICAQILVAVLLAGLMAPGTFLMSLTFPPAIRCMGVSFSYNIGAAIVGGMIPSINLALYKWHNSVWEPAYFLIFVALIAGVFLFGVKEPKEKLTNPVKPCPRGPG